MKKLLFLLLVLALMLCGCLPVGNPSALSGDDLVVALAFPADDFSSMSPEQKAAYTAACLELEHPVRHAPLKLMSRPPKRGAWDFARL